MVPRSPPTPLNVARPLGGRSCGGILRGHLRGQCGVLQGQLRAVAGQLQGRGGSCRARRPRRARCRRRRSASVLLTPTRRESAADVARRERYVRLPSLSLGSTKIVGPRSPAILGLSIRRGPRQSLPGVPTKGRLDPALSPLRPLSPTRIFDARFDRENRAWVAANVRPALENKLFQKRWCSASWSTTWSTTWRHGWTA